MFLFLFLRATPSGIYGLFLALCSGIIPDCAQGTRYSAKDRIRTGYKQDSYLVLSLSHSLSHPFTYLLPLTLIYSLNFINSFLLSSLTLSLTLSLFHLLFLLSPALLSPLSLLKGLFLTTFLYFCEDRNTFLEYMTIHRGETLLNKSASF